MKESPVHTIAVVGTGVIGRSWACVFSRAGCPTRLYDPDPAQLERALAWLKESGALTGPISTCDSLTEALAGVDYVQESGPEGLAAKRAIFVELDRLAPKNAILASSTSALDMTAIADGLLGAGRAIVAHPVNPPHVIPVVEVLAGTRTDPEVVGRTLAFLSMVGQSPVLLKSYVPGFLLNRMQAALVREAMYLVESGVADVDAVDAVIRDGLGLRWALLGPFGVADTNADGGVREYFGRYGGSYRELMNDLGSTPSFDREPIERLGRATDAMTKAPRNEILEWRDRLIRKIRDLKQEDPMPQEGSHDESE
jgi:3-hydroxyacyl-CoA dehydrogenase